MTDDTKPFNPKDAFGSAKVPLGLIPDTALVEWSMAHLEGALKYGKFNWRVVGVRASIYQDAMHRHMTKWWNGQDRDPSTRVRELASVMACCAILIDSEICGVLEDDRPPVAPLGDLLDANMELVAHLKDLFKDHHPKQPTWEDSPQLANGPLESEPTPQGELFPDAYEAYLDSNVTTASTPLGDVPTMPRAPLVAPADPVPAPFAAPTLTLDCGCVKRCKGHTTENFRALPVATMEAPSVAIYTCPEDEPRLVYSGRESRSIPEIFATVVPDPQEFDPAD